MEQTEEQRQAAETLAMIHGHQERTRRAAGLPWWVYAVVFGLSAGLMAANDFVNLSGTKLIAALVLGGFVAALVIGVAAGSAPLSRIRGVQPRQSFGPLAFGVMVVGALGAWLISRYDSSFSHAVADAVGLRHYPNTVAGVLYGAGFSALFALLQLLITSQRRERR